MRMQVFCGDDHIGFLRVSEDNDRGNSAAIVVHHLPELSAISTGPLDEDVPVAASVTRYELDIGQRGFTVDDMHAKFAGDDYLHVLKENNNAPEEGVRTIVDHARMCTHYRWRVLVVSRVQMEEIFDLDIFEPADTDIDWDACRPLRPWEHEVLGPV